MHVAVFVADTDLVNWLSYTKQRTVMSTTGKSKLENRSMTCCDLHLPKLLLDEVRLKGFEEHGEPAA